MTPSRRSVPAAIAWISAGLVYLTLEAVTAAAYRPHYSYARDFISGEVYTRWLDDFLLAPQPASEQTADEKETNSARDYAAAIAVALWQASSRTAQTSNSDTAPPPISQWKLEGRLAQLSGLGRG